MAYVVASVRRNAYQPMITNVSSDSSLLLIDSLPHNKYTVSVQCFTRCLLDDAEWMCQVFSPFHSYGVLSFLILSFKNLIIFTKQRL